MSDGVISVRLLRPTKVSDAALRSPLCGRQEGARLSIGAHTHPHTLCTAYAGSTAGPAAPAKVSQWQRVCSTVAISPRFCVPAADVGPQAAVSRCGAIGGVRRGPQPGTPPS